jgi:hypothetical protein
MLGKRDDQLHERASSVPITQEVTSNVPSPQFHQTSAQSRLNAVISFHRHMALYISGQIFQKVSALLPTPTPSGERQEV